MNQQIVKDQSSPEKPQLAFLGSSDDENSSSDDEQTYQARQTKKQRKQQAKWEQAD